MENARLAGCFFISILWGVSSFGAPLKVVLRLKPKVTMEDLARQVTDPHSPRYGKFFTPEEIRALSAPDDTEYAAQIQMLRQEGLQILSESKTHLWISVAAEKSQMEKTFLTQISEQGGGRFRLSSRVHIPSHWGWIEGCTGLDSTRSRKSQLRLRSTGGGDFPSDSIAPDTIKTVYGFDAIYAAGINGSGQHIAVATYDAVPLADIQTYYTNIGLNPLPTVDAVPFNGVPSEQDDSAMETAMDAELSGMIAPGASIHVFSSATNDDAGEAQMFTAILDDNRSKILNYSWGQCEKGVDPNHATEMAALFQRAIAQGVNIMNASGDLGATDCPNDTTLSPLWPSTSPYVVSVGGTTLSVSGNTASETAWGPCGSWDGCGGGGISTLYDRPDFQSSLPGTFAKRSIPDVAFNADASHSSEPVWVHFDGEAKWISCGGTSMAGPQWSGLMALVNSARVAKGKATLGFLNPIIYGMTADQRATSFNDIVTGSIGAFDAGPGWDAATGWGTPKANALFQYLVSL